MAMPISVFILVIQGMTVIFFIFYLSANLAAVSRTWTGSRSFYLTKMADAINPGSAILERAGVSSSWIMVEYKTFPVGRQTFTVNSFDIACILSWNYNSVNLPGLFIAGAGFSVQTSTVGSGIILIQSSTSTSITMNVTSLSSGYTVSIIFYKFPSE